MTEWKLQSYPEMLQALYQLKAATRIYRQERTAENAALMLEKFPAAAMAAAENAAAWTRVMSGAAAGVLDRAADEDYVDDHAGELRQFPDVSASCWAYHDIVEATNAHSYRVYDGEEHWM